jgi:hypothetical protein
MDFKQLKNKFIENGCGKLYIKELAPNDNSKNQVYLGGSFDILNIFPLLTINTSSAGDWKRERFKAEIKFAWIDEEEIYDAPTSQLILYPKYPEVRFSGFLRGCKGAPSELMNSRLEGRILFLSVSSEGKVLGYVSSPDSEVSNTYKSLSNLRDYGVFKTFELIQSKSELLKELKRINSLNWIKSKRLDKYYNVLPCNSTNCGGYTLEAELGITPNGYSEPDFLGWEIKQYNVRSFLKLYSAIITLITPEPTGGIYYEDGVSSFIHKYGYLDKKGRKNRFNFGGIHKSGITQNLTGLRLELIGYDHQNKKIRNSDGRISLLDRNDNEAASWDFASLIKHWNRKHNQACYVPSQSDTFEYRKYRYGNLLLLATGADFYLFLNLMKNGLIYYDPGIKLEIKNGKEKIKRRSQFRINTKSLKLLYKNFEVIDLNS